MRAGDQKHIILLEWPYQGLLKIHDQALQLKLAIQGYSVLFLQ